jgi:hypothetical protein
MSKPHPENSLKAIEPHKFKPGQCGNPGGRPRGTSLTKRLADALEKNDGELAELIVKSLIKSGLKGSNPALQEIFNRIEGKVADRIAGHDGGELGIKIEFVQDNGD